MGQPIVGAFYELKLQKVKYPDFNLIDKQINRPVEQINRPVKTIKRHVEQINRPVKQINKPVEQINRRLTSVKYKACLKTHIFASILCMLCCVP